MSDQIVYQIFPDRFAIGGPHTSDSKLALPQYAHGQHRRWTDSPLGGQDFFGGDLQGIIDRLDYLAELGVTTLYLTPIFQAPSNHKYDTTDYLQVDAQFGDDQRLRTLIEALHGRGMRLIMDISINHVSDRHPWFVKARNGESPYRDWFTFKPDGRYLCWRDHGHMPELDLRRPDLQDRLFRQPDSIMQHYLAMGLDGWRLDVAADMGISVMEALREAISIRYADRILIGEVMAFVAGFVGDSRRYHGVMNYYFRDGALAWLNGRVSGLQLIEALRDASREGILSSWNMLSSHDTPRLANLLPQAWQRWLALVLQFTTPGVPVVYYGEEVGMQGGFDPDCRRPMLWDASDWSPETVGWYRTLIELRRTRRELREGCFIALSHVLNTETVAFIRHTDVPQEVSLVAVNPSDKPFKAVLLLPYPHLYHDLPLRDALGSHSHLKMGAGSVDVEVAPRSAAVWVPDDSRYRNYTFFKGA